MSARSKLAGWLRRWADRLDPPIPAAVPVASQPPVVGATGTFKVIRRSTPPVIVYRGDSGAQARDAVAREKRLGHPGTLMHHGQRRDWWPR